MIARKSRKKVDDQVNPGHIGLATYIIHSFFPIFFVSSDIYIYIYMYIHTSHLSYLHTSHLSLTRTDPY